MLCHCCSARPIAFAFGCALFLLLSSTVMLRVGAVFKLLDANASLVNNPKKDVVYVFQFPRTSTTPSQAAYNLMVETWLHWNKTPFHRISNQLFLGSHSLGTAPFAYFNGKYTDGSVEIIENIAKYKMSEEEKKLMQMVLEMFNILMVDRAAGLAWMVKDEALVEIIVPQSFADRTLTVTLHDVSFSVTVNQDFWKQYFDAYNAEAETVRVEFVEKFLNAENETDQQKNQSEQRPSWTEFNGWLRTNVINRTMETVLMETVNGKPNTANAANSQAKLKEFLQINELVSAVNGTKRPYSEYSVDEISEELRARWEHMSKLVQENNNASLRKKAQSLADAALFGILVQYFETPLNLEQFKAFSAKNGPLFEFTKNVKQSLGLDAQQWEALTKRPWQLNFDTEHVFRFTAKSAKYDGPYDLQAVGDLKKVYECINYVDSIVSISNNCTKLYPVEVILSAEALINIANEFDMTFEVRNRYYHAQAMIAVMASYLCNVRTHEQKHLERAKKLYKEELKMTDKEQIKGEMEQVRRMVFETINAYNDAKTGEAVHAAVLKVRAVVNKGGDAAIAAVSPTSLTNEH